MKFLTFLLLLTGIAFARDNGQYANDPNHEWFAHQRNSAGVSCCEIADGHRLKDADWGFKDNHFWVRLDGKETQVPDLAVINPPDRPVDYAVVWIYQGRIECFMPGAGV